METQLSLKDFWFLNSNVWNEKKVEKEQVLKTTLNHGFSTPGIPQPSPPPSVPQPGATQQEASGGWASEASPVFAAAIQLQLHLKSSGIRFS